jgi:hypothetical protein
MATTAPRTAGTGWFGKPEDHAPPPAAPAPRGSRSPGRSQLAAPASAALALMPLAIGLVLWGISLEHIALARLGSAGLPGIAPPTWFAALAVLIAGAAVSIWTGAFRWWTVALYIGAMVAVLYATIPALTNVPQYTWTFKHIGVTRYILAHGTVNPAIDLYNRWPGMFSLAAALSRLTGIDPVSFAAWIEPVFTALDALLITAIARTITRDRRVAAMSALAWVCSDWVGQIYVSPQTLAFTLDLALLLIVIGQLSIASESIVLRRLRRSVARVTRRAQPAERFGSRPTVGYRTSIVLVLLIDVVIVATHQLTPVMVLLQLSALLALGLLRPRWLLLACAACTVAYFAPNAPFLQSHYGLFSGFNPFSNGTVQTELPIHRAALFARGGQLLSFAAALLALAGAVALVRNGKAGRATALLSLMAVPVVILFAQNYGGEAVLRVFFFSSPWRDILVASGIAAVARPWRAVVATVATAALAGLFVIAALGNAGTNVIPAGEVAAADYFYAHAPAESVLVVAGADVPLRIGARYPLIKGPSGSDFAPDILGDVPSFHKHVLGARDIPAVARDLLQYSRQAYLVFSTTQFAYAAIFHTTPPGSLEHLQAAVAHSARFRLWYANRNTWIYQLLRRSGTR